MKIQDSLRFAMWRNLKNLSRKLVEISHFEHVQIRSYGWTSSIDSHQRLCQLVAAYRAHGHKKAMVNPILSSVQTKGDLHVLNPEEYGLNLHDNNYYLVDGLIHSSAKQMKLRDILKVLRDTYCSCIGIESEYLSVEEKEWMFQNFEYMQSELCFTKEERRLFLEELLRVQAFEKYLAVKFPTVKRYGIEGGETMITFFQSLFKKCVLEGVTDVVLAFPHRGRLSLLCTLLELQPSVVFSKMRGFAEFPADYQFTGDVLSHLRNSVDVNVDGVPLHVSMLPNPSHLEAVSPVVVGKVRSMLQRFCQGDYSREPGKESPPSVMGVQVHGDASFSGQGVVMETLAISKVPHFRVGGCLHLITNNQLGFTTPAENGRSSFYCSDVMKMIEAPVIHVNGAYPEEVAKAAFLAFGYWKKFRKDVLVDLLCFRRHGHNEMDDPTFTNPKLYQSISLLPSFADAYSKVIEDSGIVTHEEKQAFLKSYAAVLDENFKKSNSEQYQCAPFADRWKYFKQADNSISVWDTGLPVDLLKFVGMKSVSVSNCMAMHPTLKKHFVSDRIKRIESGQKIDWATAEALAVGSLLYQGYNVRLSGQDVGRGTFSHRHFMVTDQQTGQTYVPLNNMLSTQKAFLEVANSILSEEAVLGFEYGFSIDNPNTLVMWEAQFGDFFNSAQVVFDTCISSTETKWLMQSGIVILLPHGYDGGGPEHSSCRMERFLQMSDSKENGIDGDDVNWFVVNPTTPAQIFHLLRKQVICNYRKPLVVVSPKVILRHPSAVSSLSDMSSATTFNPIITGNICVAHADRVKHLIFCSGKHYYNLNKEKIAKEKTDTALIRIEQLCPFPAAALHEATRKFKNAVCFTWSQEEHQNMGAWNFVDIRFQNIFGIKLRYVGRKPLSTPAVGIQKLHELESNEVLERSFQGSN